MSIQFPSDYAVMGDEITQVMSLISVCRIAVQHAEEPDFYPIEDVLKVSIDKLLNVLEQLQTKDRNHG